MLWVIISNGAILHIKEYSSVVYMVFVVVAVLLADTKTAQQQVVKYHTFHFSLLSKCCSVAIFFIACYVVSY